MSSSSNTQGKKLALRMPDTCARCEAALDVGTQAVWFAASRTVRCVPCVKAESGPSSVTALVAATTQPPQHDAEAATSLAGASAQREYDRRSARELAKKQKLVDEDEAWRAQVKQDHPILGRLAALTTEKPKITPESQPTTAWKTGAEGELRVGDRLDGVDHIVALHDLAVPKSRANIDHIAVTPTGIYVVDAKKYKGQIECRNVGGFFNSDHRLFVRGRDRSKLVDAMLWQIDVVRKVLGPEREDVPIHGVLCFVDGDFGLVPTYFSVRGVRVVGLSKLSKTLQAPGEFGFDELNEIAQLLTSQLRPAVLDAAS